MQWGRSDRSGMASHVQWICLWWGVYKNALRENPPQNNQLNVYGRDDAQSYLIKAELPWQTNTDSQQVRVNHYSRQQSHQQAQIKHNIYTTRWFLFIFKLWTEVGTEKSECRRSTGVRTDNKSQLTAYGPAYLKSSQWSVPALMPTPHHSWLVLVVHDNFLHTVYSILIMNSITGLSPVITVPE